MHVEELQASMTCQIDGPNMRRGKTLGQGAYGEVSQVCVTVPGSDGIKRPKVVAMKVSKSVSTSYQWGVRFTQRACFGPLV